MRMGKNKSAKLEASHSRALASQSDEEEEDDTLLQCIMCNCTTIEDYLKRHIRYNHLICKDDIIEKLYKLHYPPENCTISTQTDVTWVHGDKHKKEKYVEQEEQEYYSDGGGMEDAVEDHGMDNGQSDEEEVLCPACGDVEDGTPMIACDLCDRWYHWVCVGITATPTKGQEWVCNGCGKDSDHLGKRAIKTSVEEDEIMDMKKIKEEFPHGRMSNRSASRASRDDDIKVTAVVRPRRGDFDPGSPSHESTPRTKKKASSPVNERSTKQKKVQRSPVLALPEPEVPRRGKAKFKYASRRYKADLSPETTEDESEISPDDDPDFDARNEHVDKDDMNLYIRSSKKSGGKAKPKGNIRRKSSLDESNIDDMSRDELREMCKKECLKATGSRDELLTRLKKSRNISSNRNSKTQKREQERQQNKEKEKKKLNSTKHTLIEITEGDGTDDDFCKICFLGADLPEDLELGPLYKYGVCQAHLHCLMFSSGLIQTGEDDEGIHGFMPDEIVAEWRRGGKLKCSYCKEIYATVGCSVRTCLKTYHLPCGIKNGALHEYYGNFDSYCSVHRNTRPNRNKHKKEYVLTDVGLVPSWVDEEAENDKVKKRETDEGKKTQVKSKKKPQKKEEEDDEEDEDESLNSSNKSKKLSRKRETKKQGDESKTSEEDEDVDLKSRVTKRRRRIQESDEGKRTTSEEEEDTEKVSKRNTRKKRKSNDENYKKSSEEEDDSFSSSKKSKGNNSHTNKNVAKTNESDNKISEDEGNTSKVNRGSKRKTKFQKKRNRILKDDDDSDIKPNSSDEEDNKNEDKIRYTKSKSEDEKENLWETVGNKSGKGKNKEKERKTKSSSEDEDVSSKSKLRSTRRRRVSDSCKQKSSSEEEGTVLKSRTRNKRKGNVSNENKNKISSDGENNKENSNEDDEEKNKDREKEKEKERLWKSMAFKSKYPNDKDEHSDDDIKHSQENEEEENINEKKGNKSIQKETSEINDFVSDNDDTLGFDPPDDSDNEEDPKKPNIKGRKKRGKAESYQESDNEDVDSKESLFDQIKNPKRKKSNVKDTSKTDKITTNQDDDVNDNPEGFELHDESEKENKLEKKKIIKDKKTKNKSKQDSENDMTPENHEDEEEHDIENNDQNDMRRKNKRGKRVDVHQESEDNQFSDDDNTNKKEASTSRNSRRNGTFSTIKIVDETAETRGRPSRNCQKKPLVEDDDESDDNRRSARKKNQANVADKFGSGVDRPSRKCSRNAIVEVEEHQDNEEKIPFRRSHRNSVNTADDLKSNDQPSIEDNLRSMEVDSEHEEMAPLAISEDTSDEEKCEPISRKSKMKTKKTYNDTEDNNKLSEEDEEAKEERRKELEKERLWKSMAIKSKSTTSENDADLSDDRQSEDDDGKNYSKLSNAKNEHSSNEDIKERVKIKIKKKFKDKKSEEESDDETDKPSIKLRINTKTLKSKKHHGESEEDILNEETLPLNNSTESGHTNLEQNDGLNDCADLPNMSTENASVEEELSDHDGIDLTKILESLNREPENLPHHCFHFQCTLCNFNDINRDIIDDHIRVQHKKTKVKNLSKKKEMMLFIESYKLSQAEKTLVKHEMKNVNQNSGTYLKRLMEHFHFFKFVSDDMPEEIVELPDRLSEYCNSDAQSVTSSESSESKACRRISKRPLKDKDFVDWNELNPKKLRKDPAQSSMSDEDNVSVDSETTAQINMSNLTRERTTRNKKHHSEPEEDSPIPQNDTTSPLPMSSLRKSSVSQNSKWTSHSPRSGSQSSNEDDKRAGSLSPSANSPTQCFECLKCGTKIKLTEDLVIKHLNRHKMTLKDYIEFYHAEDEVPLQWQGEDSFNPASECDEKVLKDHMSSHNKPEENKNEENSFKGFVDETCLAEDDICSKSKTDEKRQEFSGFASEEFYKSNESPSKDKTGTPEPVQQCFSPGRRIAEIPDTEEFSDIYMAKYTDENGHERIWVEEFNADGMPGLYVNGKATGSVDVAEIRKAIELKANIPERFEKMVFMIKPKGSPRSEYKSNKDLLREMDKAEEERKPKIILKLPRPAKNKL